MESTSERATDDLPPPPNARVAEVAGYEIEAEIGRGAMGVVYRARQVRLGRVVALKLLRSGALADRAERERFLREARAEASLQHPAIVQVFDVGEHDGSPYLAREYVDGETLSRRLLDGPLPARDAANLLESLAKAVQYAHERGVVHRDLKPANVLLSGSEPKIADFGLARIGDEPGGTQSGAVLGTPAYMAPEQASGHAAQAGPAADIYALGAILYECLTGQPPFQAATPMETLRQVVADEPSRASSRRSGVPRDLDTICATCLEKEPRRRYASAAALAGDLRRFLDGRPILARPVGVTGRAVRWVRRNPRVASLLALLALALLAALVQRRRSERLYQLAESRRESAEENLARYREAAEDFGGLLDALDTDQLFHLRATSLRNELVLPALERSRQFIDRHAGDPDRQADVAKAHFRVAMLTRILSNPAGPAARRAALEPARQALGVHEAFSERQPDVVQYRRDRAALTHNYGFLLHGAGRTAEAIPVLESACRQRQELLDMQPGNLDYRSELAGCWNDRGMALPTLNRLDEAVACHDRAIELQSAVVAAAPQVPRYRQFLCNHHFNRAVALRGLGRDAEAIADVAETCRLLPLDPEQWYRKARILASVDERSDSARNSAEALADLRRAVRLGLPQARLALDHGDLRSVQKLPEFQELLRSAERQDSSADRQ